MSYLLDTNHCSDIINGNPQVIEALKTRAGSTISVSIITYYLGDFRECENEPTPRRMGKAKRAHHPTTG